MFFFQKKSADQILSPPAPALAPTTIRHTTIIENESEDVDDNDNDNNSNNNCPIEVWATLSPTVFVSNIQNLIVLFGGPAPHQFQKAMSLNKWLFAKLTWKTFGNYDFNNYLSSVTDWFKYHNSYCRFYARLILISCNFSVDELYNIFCATMPNFIHEGTKYKWQHDSKCFYDTYNLMQDNFVDKLCFYALLWLQTTGGKDYASWSMKAK